MGKVGIAPGTTTLTIGPGGTVDLVGLGAQQDPGVRIRDAAGNLVGAGLGYFDARPTDMQLAKIRGYLPVHRGWISGRVKPAQSLAGAHACEACAMHGEFGQFLDLGITRNKAITLGVGAIGAMGGAIALHGRGRALTAFGAGMGALLAGLLGSMIAGRMAPSVASEAVEA